VAHKRTITIEVSERTAEALEYYRFLNGIDPAKVASSMVEYCCANSFQQGPDLIKDFALDALKWRPGRMWDRYSTRWDRLENWPAHSALANLAAATDQMRQRKLSL
jgi:hypothetical protein